MQCNLRKNGKRVCEDCFPFFGYLEIVILHLNFRISLNAGNNTRVRDKMARFSLTDFSDSQIYTYFPDHREGKALRDGTDA